MEPEVFSGPKKVPSSSTGKDCGGGNSLPLQMKEEEVTLGQEESFLSYGGVEKIRKGGEYREKKGS